MRMLNVTGLAAVLIWSAAPAIAMKTAKEQPVADESGGATATSERKICRQLQHTGTRLKNERVCLPKADWKKVDAIR